MPRIHKPTTLNVFRVATALTALVLMVTVAVPNANATVAYRAASTNSTSGASTIDGSTPSGTLQGDIMIAYVSVRGGVSISTPSGWTAIANTNTVATTDVRGAAFYKFAGASEAGPYTFSLGGSQKAAVVIVAYSGVDTSTPIDVSSGAGVTTASTTLTTPDVTTTVDNAMVVAMFGVTYGTTLTASGSYTIRGQVQSSTGNSATKNTAGIEDRVLATAGSTGTTGATSGNSATYTSAIVALKPVTYHNQGHYRWFPNSDSTTPTTPTASQDAATTLDADTPIRLRFGIGAGSAGAAIPSGTTYKLQYAEKSGTCDVNFTGESYADISAHTPVAFYDNPTPSDGAAYVSGGNDPASYGGSGSVSQTYIEANPFSVATTIPSDQDGKWDASLVMPSRYGPWVTQTTGTTQWTDMAVSSDGHYAVAITAGSSIQQSTDYGQTWSVATSTGGSNASFAMSSNGAIRYAGPNGGILRYSTNYGSSWGTLTNSPSVYWYDVATSDDGAVIAGASGGVYVSTDSGTSWNSPSSIGASAVAMSSDGSRMVAIGGTSDKIYTSSDTGSSWTEQTNAPSVTYNEIAMSGDGSTVYATVNSGNMYKSTDYGVTWNAVSSLGTKAWTRVSVSQDGSTAIGSVSAGGLYISYDYGTTWTHEYTGAYVWSGAAVTKDGSMLFGASNLNIALLTSKTISYATAKSYCIRAVRSSGALLNNTFQVPELTLAQPSVGQSDYRWFANADSVTPGSPLASQNTATSVEPGTGVRLRSRLPVSGSVLSAGDQDFKLQYAEKTAACSALSYSDVKQSGTAMSSTLVPGSFTSVNDGNVLTPSWTQLSYGTVQDGNYVQSNSKDAIGQSTEVLKLDNFGFSIPSNATITGYTFHMYAKSTLASFGAVLDQNARIIDASGSMVGTSQVTSAWEPYDHDRDYGGSSNQWDTSLTYNDVNNSNFGVGFQVNISGDGSSPSYARIDYATLTVHYTIPSTGTAIDYLDNASVATGASIGVISGDPTSTGRQTIYQKYIETDPFTSGKDIPAGGDGLWDYAINTGSLAAGKTYCFRVAQSDGNPLDDGYTYYPELTVNAASSGPTLSQQTRGGGGVVGGVKYPYSW